MRLADVFVAVRADMTDVNKAFKGLESSLGGVGKSLTTMGASLTRNVTLPILAVGGATAKMGLDFERTMGQLVGLAGVPAAEIDGLRDSIMSMAQETGRGPQELAEAFYFVASAGFEANEAMEVLDVSARASAAGMGQVQDIARVLGGVINAYGKENLAAATAADMLTAAVSSGAAEASEFAAALPQVVPTAAMLGVEFNEVAGAMAAITTTGATAATAAVGLNQVFTSLLKPTKEANDTLADFGLSAQGLREQLREEGTVAVLRTLEQTFGDNEEAMTKVFGNVRAMRGAFSLLGLDAKQLDDIMAGVANSEDALAEAFAAIPDDVLAFDRAMADLKVQAILLGRDVLPTVVDVLKKVADTVRAVVGWWRSLDDGTKDTIINFVLFAAVAGPVLTILGRLVFVLKGVVGGVKGVVMAGKLLHRAWLHIPSLMGYVDLAMGKATKAMGGFAGVARVVMGLGLAAAVYEIGTAVADLLAKAMHGDEAGEAFKRISDELGLLGIATGEVHHVFGGLLEISKLTGKPIGELTDRFIELRASGMGWLDILNVLADETLEFANAQGSSSSAAHGWSEAQKQAYAEMYGSAKGASGQVVGEFTDMNGDLVTVFEDGTSAVNGEFTGMTEDMIKAARKAREAAVDHMSAMLKGMAALFETDEQVREAFQGLMDRMDDPYTEAERKADIFSKDLLTLIKTALDSDDPGAVAATVEFVNRMLREFELLEPGALETGEGVPPALKSGMDSEIGSLIDWIETNVTGEVLSNLTLEEAEQLGIDGIFLYNEGMLSQERAANTAAQRVADSAKQGAGAIDFTETGETHAGQLEGGIISRVGDIRLAGVFAAQAAKGGFNGVSFYDSGANIINELIFGINDNVWRLQSAIRGASQVSGAITIESEPKDPRSGFRGITKWGGNIVKTIAAGIYGSLGIAQGASRALSYALVPTMPGLGAPMASPVSPLTLGGGLSAAGGGNTYHVHVERLPDHPTLKDIGGELRRLGEMGLLPGSREKL